MNLKFSIDMCLSDKDHFFLKYVMYWIEKIWTKICFTTSHRCVVIFFWSFNNKQSLMLRRMH